MELLKVVALGSWDCMRRCCLSTSQASARGATLPPRRVRVWGCRRAMPWQMWAPVKRTLVPGARAVGIPGQGWCSTATSLLLPSVSSRRSMRRLWGAPVAEGSSRASTEEASGAEISREDWTWRQRVI